MTGRDRLALGSARKNLPDLMQFALHSAERSGIPSARLLRVEMALEEMLLNVMDHSRPDGSGRIELHVGPDTETGRWCAELRDDGPPFDPLAAPEPDLEAGVEQRPVGGLGIHLVRQTCDLVRYERQGGQNVLLLCFDLPA